MLHHHIFNVAQLFGLFFSLFIQPWIGKVQPVLSVVRCTGWVSSSVWASLKKIIWWTSLEVPLTATLLVWAISCTSIAASRVGAPTYSKLQTINIVTVFDSQCFKLFHLFLLPEYEYLRFVVVLLCTTFYHDTGTLIYSMKTPETHGNFYINNRNKQQSRFQLYLYWKFSLRYYIM